MASENSVAELHDARVGEKTYCKNCRHAFTTKINLKDSILVCHGLPPQVAAQPILDRNMAVQNVAISSHFIPRAVPADYWCSLFELAADKADS